MENKLHNIDELFAKTLGEHSVEPPAYVWDNIKSNLDAASGKRRARIGWITGTASAVVLSFIGGYFIANKISENEMANIPSEKITNVHTNSIDVNHFWNLRSVVIGETTTSGGHTFTTTFGAPNGTGNTGGSDMAKPYTETNSSQDDFTGKEHGKNGPMNYGTNTVKDKNKRPRSGNISVTPASSHEEESGKKTNAATTDVNKDASGIQQEAEINGFTSVAADHNVQSSRNNNVENLTITPQEVNTNPVADTKVSEGNTPVDVHTNSVVVEAPLVRMPQVASYTPATVNTGDPANETKTDMAPVNTVADNNTKGNTRNTSNQDEKGEPDLVKGENPTSFTILPYFSPNYTLRNSVMRNTNGTQNAFGTNPAFSEKTNFSYSAGVLLGYNFTPRLTVFIGASYTSISNSTSRNNIHTRSFDQLAPSDSATPVITTAGVLSEVNVVPTETGTPEDPTYIVQDNIIGQVNTITQNFSFIEVPVLLRYKLFGPKIGLTFTGGISTGFIVQNDVVLEGANGTRKFGSTSNIRNFNMNASFGIGIEARLLPFMYLNIEPTIRYSFLNWSMDDRFQVNPVMFGVTTGLAFKI